MKKRTIAIVPARYGSTRFPGKPLKKLLGKTIICRVVENIISLVDRVVVATDDKRIYDEVLNNGYEAVMTDISHNSGTERIIEAFEILNEPFDIIINVQGDEPFINKSQIQELIKAFDDNVVDIATVAVPFDKETPNSELFDSSKVKVVMRNDGMALYFSRHAIPFMRDFNTSWCERIPYYKHIGLYAFRSDVLSNIKKLQKSYLEDSERLEQLKWLQNGLMIKVLLTEDHSVGIDTPSDLEAAKKYIKAIHDR